MIRRTKHCHTYTCYFNIKISRVLFHLEFIIWPYWHMFWFKQTYKIHKLIAFYWQKKLYLCNSSQEQLQSKRERITEVEGKLILFEGSIRQTWLEDVTVTSGYAFMCSHSFEHLQVLGRKKKKKKTDIKLTFSGAY